MNDFLAFEKFAKVLDFSLLSSSLKSSISSVCLLASSKSFLFLAICWKRSKDSLSYPSFSFFSFSLSSAKSVEFPPPTFLWNIISWISFLCFTVAYYHKSIKIFKKIKIMMQKIHISNTQKIKKF